MLDGHPGVSYMMDDIIIFGHFRKEHNASANILLKRLEENSMILNFEKCHIAKCSSSYLGHVISHASDHGDGTVYQYG